MTEPYTAQEVRNQFLDQLESSVDYWDTVDGFSQKEKLEALAFSFLVLIDGMDDSFPVALRIVPDPAREDRAYLEAKGEPWYPENHAVELHGEITDRKLFGYLRDDWARRRPH